MAAKQALEGTRLNAFGMDPEALVIIGLDTSDGPEHPLYDERIHLPLDENMVRNVMAIGVLETVLVRKNGDAVEIVDGKQRTRMAREANKRLVAQGKEPIRVPVMVKRGQDGEMYGILISANEVRRDDTPLIKATKLNRYLNMGYSLEQAAVAFGVTKVCVTNWQKLLDLDKEVVKAIEAGTISASAGGALSDLSREQQKDALKKLTDAGAGTATNAKTLADEAKAAAAGDGRDGKDGDEKKQGEQKKRPKPVLKKRHKRGPNRARIKEVLKAAHNVTGASDDAVMVLEWVLGFQTDDIIEKHVKGFAKVFAQAAKK